MGVTAEQRGIRRHELVRLMQAIAAGDRSALGEVYQLTSRKLLGIVVRIIPERELAEDVLQDVYLKVWRRAGRFDPDRASPITWLAVIARNAAIDEARRRPAASLHDGDDAIDALLDDGPAADDLLCDADEQAAVRRCIDSLETDQRSSILLAFFDGLSHVQLAARRGVPLGTMKSWIRRGLASLKGCMDHGRA